MIKFGFDLVGGIDMKYTTSCNSNTLINENGTFNCPVCGRKRNVLQSNGDIRLLIHCKCRTGNHHTVFKFDMGAYIYRSGDSGHLLIV